MGIRYFPDEMLISNTNEKLGSSPLVVDDGNIASPIPLFGNHILPEGTTGRGVGNIEVLNAPKLR